LEGHNYVPELTHPALKWSAKDPLPLLSVVTDAPWQIIEKKQANKKKQRQMLRLQMMLQKFNLDLLQLKEVYLLILARKGRWKMMKAPVQALKNKDSPNDNVLC